MISFLKHCFTAVALVVLCLGSAVISQAVVVLDENFEGAAAGTYFTGSTVGKFLVQSGSVDVLTTTFFGGLCTAAGGSPICIDLDGTGSIDGPGTPSGSTFSSTQFFPKGTYDLSFDLAGNQRGDAPKLTTLFFGDLPPQPIVLPSSAPFHHFSFLGVTVGGISPSSRIVFDNTTSNDNIGNLLDNVLLIRREVPEPPAFFLLVIGLAGLGASLRRWRHRSDCRNSSL